MIGNELFNPQVAAMDCVKCRNTYHHSGKCDVHRVRECVECKRKFRCDKCRRFCNDCFRKRNYLVRSHAVSIAS